MARKREGVNITATDPATGAEVDTSELEKAGVCFDPTQVHLDLTKEEKRRTTALLLAIQAYDKLIIKDAEMYTAISREAGRDPEMKIRPATMTAMVRAAIDFDDFISGKLQSAIEQTLSAGPSDPSADAKQE